MEHECETRLDAALGVLANRHRRTVLEALVSHAPDDGPVEIPADVDRSDLTAETVALEMRHCHLPKLEARGFVEWDRERNEVRRGPQFEELEPVVTLLRENADELRMDWP